MFDLLSHVWLRLLRTQQVKPLYLFRYNLSCAQLFSAASKFGYDSCDRCVTFMEILGVSPRLLFFKTAIF